MLSTWFMVLLLALKPVCRLEKRLFDSRNHFSLRLIIFSSFARTAGSSYRLITGRVCGIFLFFHKVGMLPEIQIYQGGITGILLGVL